MDTAGRIGFGNAAFEFNEEEIPEVIDELFNSEDTTEKLATDTTPSPFSKRFTSNTLKDTLERKSIKVS